MCMIRQFFYAAIILLTAPVLMSSSCRKLTDKPAGDCEGVMCTMMFASVSTSVVDASGAPVQLDKVYTVRVSTGEQITPEQHMSPGSYIVLDDSYQKRMVNSTEQFTFTGFKNGKKVVEEQFVIGADCCHVHKVSGSDRIVAR